MDDDIDHLSSIPGVPPPPPSGIARWVPAAVVLSAVVGFSTLAYYAYHAGVRSVSDQDLMVVEADHAPMKEKPLDPGGMQFPNQDKTIFETFANNGQTPPKVERLLPTPEEPMPKQLDTSDTTTWVNKNATDDKAAPAPAAGAKSEQVIGEKKTETPEAKKEAAPAPAKAEESKDAKTKEEKPVTVDSTIMSYTVDKNPQPAKTVATPPPDKKTKPVAVSNADAPKAEKPASGGSSKVQLGAYRSEKEASSAWSAMQKKYKETAGKSPIIVKADLGDKGIYYRLRVGFANASDAKDFCKSLSAKGQGCLLSKD